MFKDDNSMLVDLYTNVKITLTDYDITLGRNSATPPDFDDFILKKWRKFLNKKFKTYKEDLKNYMQSQIDDVMAYLN